LITLSCFQMPQLNLFNALRSYKGSPTHRSIVNYTANRNLLGRLLQGLKPLLLKESIPFEKPLAFQFGNAIITIASFIMKRHCITSANILLIIPRLGN
jgi:hypothetical protein